MKGECRRVIVVMATSRRRRGRCRGGPSVDVKRWADRAPANADVALERASARGNGHRDGGGLHSSGSRTSRPSSPAWQHAGAVALARPEDRKGGTGEQRGRRRTRRLAVAVRSGRDVPVCEGLREGRAEDGC